MVAERRWVRLELEEGGANWGDWECERVGVSEQGGGEVQGGDG